MHKGDELDVFIQFLCTDKCEHLHRFSTQIDKLKLEPRRIIIVEQVSSTSMILIK